MIGLDKKNSYAITLLISVISGLVGGALMTLVLMTYGSFNFATMETTVNLEQVDYVNAWEEASPAVISIVALKDLSSYYNQFNFNDTQSQQNDTGDGEGELSEVSSGTAFILTPDGLAVTNKHVVEDDAAEYVAILSDGVELDVEVLGKDPLNDIALVQLSSEENSDLIGDLPYLEFSDSDEISVGEPVLAIGNALGEYSNTTTAGIISGTGRNILAASGYGSTESLVGLIQTDAAINPGNSGGPLVDMTGKVIGMNTAVDTTAEGIGFAIPANDISMVVLSYQEYGRIVRPFLGVRYVMVTEGLINRLGLSVDHGAFLTGDAQAGLPSIVPDSSADKSGLKEGDVILTFGGKELNENYNLSNAVAGYFVGEEVVLEVFRGGETIEITLTLEEQNKE